MNPSTDARAERRTSLGVAWLAAGVLLLGSAPSPAGPQPSPQQYLLVGTPSDRTDTDQAGVSVLVYDVGQDHRLVNRIPIWSPDDTQEYVRGMTPSPQGATGPQVADNSRLYISTTRRLGAIDLTSGRLVWERDYGGQCCERAAVSPDGRTLYVPAFGRAVWYVVDAATGDLESTISVMGWPRSTTIAPDGQRAFFVPWESKELLVVDTASNEIIRAVGPFTDFLCPFAINQRATMAFANVDGLVGFEVGDLLTGLVIERVQIDDYEPGQLEAIECPSHGIAFAPDDRELWVADGVGHRLRVFDSTPFPPVPMTSIPLGRQPRWVMFSHDGRHVYSSTGDVVDATSKQIVATLTDEHGRVVESERMANVSMASPPVGSSR